MYFSAIQKIGEQALQSSTSQILGEVLSSSPPPPASAYYGSPALYPWLYLFVLVFLRQV